MIGVGLSKLVQEIIISKQRKWAEGNCGELCAHL